MSIGKSQVWRKFGSLLTFAAVCASLRAGDAADWRMKMRAIEPLGYVCRFAPGPVEVDGRLDEAAWEAAAWTSDFVDIEGDRKPHPRFRTRAKMLWDDVYLYVAAEMEEPQVWGTLTEHDSVIFRDPDFEVFIDPDGDTHQYYEFEINALNTGWDLRLVKPYMDGGPPLNEWEIPGLRTAVHVLGTLNDATDTDIGWTVEIAFPWSVLGEFARHTGAPEEGEQWRINFSRVEWRISTADGAYQKIPDTPEDNWVWTPQGVIDMHRPEMWGVLQFTRATDAAPTNVTRVSEASREARALALEVYYTQRDFFAAHQRWAAAVDELALPGAASSGDVSPVIGTTPDGYRCTVGFEDNGVRRLWSIRQDRLLRIEEMPRED